MKRRNQLALMVIPLLALTVACSSAVTAIEAEPPATQREAAESAAPATNAVIEPAPVVDETPDQGLSPRTTRGHVWAEAAIDGDAVTILRSVATMGDHVHFEVPSADGSAEFIGYFLGTAFLIRPDVCPSCGQADIDWGVSVLACRSCSATFNTVTGEGRSEEPGYPEGWIPNSIFFDTIVMSLDDLLVAHARTVAGEQTLYEVPPEPEVEGETTSLPPCCAR